MKYNFNNSELSDVRLKKELDDKLIDLLCSFVENADETFYYRTTQFANDIIKNDNKISDINKTLSELPLMTLEQLKDLAKDLEVEDFNILDKDSLTSSVSKKLNDNLTDLRKQSAELSSDYKEARSHSVDRFMAKQAASFEEAIKTEHNLDMLNKYTFLKSNFKSICDKCSTLHNWMDAISPDICKIIDINDEIERLDDVIKTNQNEFASSNDYDLLVKYQKTIKEAQTEKSKLQESLTELKANALTNFGESKVQINFSDLKLQFFENLINIKANIGSANASGVVDLKEHDMEAIMITFGHFFQNLVVKENEFRDLLNQNGVSIADELITDLSKDATQNERVFIQSEPVQAEPVMSEQQTVQQETVVNDEPSPFVNIQDESKPIDLSPKKDTDNNHYDEFNLTIEPDDKPKTTNKIKDTLNELCKKMGDVVKLKVKNKEQTDEDTLNMNKQKSKISIKDNKIFIKVRGLGDKVKDGISNKYNEFISKEFERLSEKPTEELTEQNEGRSAR